MVSLDSWFMALGNLVANISKLYWRIWLKICLEILFIIFFKIFIFSWFNYHNFMKYDLIFSMVSLDSWFMALSNLEANISKLYWRIWLKICLEILFIIFFKIFMFSWFNYHNFLKYYLIFSMVSLDSWFMALGNLEANISKLYRSIWLKFFLEILILMFF